MKFVILGLLLTGPLSLYDVRKRFTAGISLFYSASFGSIRRALQQLVADGAATVSDEPGSARGKRLYSVTEGGRTAFQAWMREPVASGADSETTMLAKVYLLGRLDDPADRRDVLTALRTRARLDLEALTATARDVDAAARDLPPEHRALFAPQRATLDYGLRAHALAVAWLDELDEVAS